MQKRDGLRGKFLTPVNLMVGSLNLQPMSLVQAERMPVAFLLSNLSNTELTGQHALLPSRNLAAPFHYFPVQFSPFNEGFAVQTNKIFYNY